MAITSGIGRQLGSVWGRAESVYDPRGTDIIPGSCCNAALPHYIYYLGRSWVGQEELSSMELE